MLVQLVVHWWAAVVGLADLEVEQVELVVQAPLWLVGQVEQQLAHCY